MNKRLFEQVVLGLISSAALCAAVLLPLRAEAATELRWTQSGAAPLGYKIYFGSVSGVYTGYRDIGYVTPDSSGESSYPLQGMITTDSFVAMTAYNSAGTSPLSNEIRVVVSCNVDSDCAVPQQCKTGFCSSQLGCGTLNVADGTSCDDGDANTTGDHCLAGLCANSSPLGVGGTVTINQIIPGSTSGVVGSATSFVVSASSTGTPLFRWLVMSPSSGNWTVLRDYSWSPLFSWTPQTPGNYSVAVAARTDGAAEDQDWQAITFSVAAAPGASPTAEITLEDPEPMDGIPMLVPVVLEAMGGAGLEYRFSLFYRGKPWRVMRNFSGDPRFVWVPRLRPGTYELGVEVRNHGEIKPWGVDSTSVQIVAAPLLECSSAQGVVSCSTPPAGGELEYQWWVAGPRARWQVLHAYGEMGDSMSFTPNNGSGTYYVAVWARPVAGSPLGTRPIYTRWVAVKY